MVRSKAEPCCGTSDWKALFTKERTFLLLLFTRSFVDVVGIVVIVNVVAVVAAIVYGGHLVVGNDNKAIGKTVDKEQQIGLVLATI